MFRIVLISPEKIFSGEAELINQLMQTGNFNFHLRKNDTPVKELRKLIYLIAPEHYSRIVLHQDYELSKGFDLAGIHLKENNRADLEKLQKEEYKIVSTSIHELDKFETQYIKTFNSMVPNGYNLKNGGSVFTHSDESKKRVSDGVSNYYKDKKFERFKDIKKIDDDIEKYIKPLKRNNEQYGWYVYIDRKKADFGGVHISLEDSKISAMNFIRELKNRLARHLDAGNSLET